MLRQTNFIDALDPRFLRIEYQAYSEIPDQVGNIFFMDPGSGQASERYSQEGTLGELSAFTGTVSYDDSFEGYRAIITPSEKAGGIQIERKLMENVQSNLFKLEQKPRSLGSSAYRTRQVDAARLFNNAFSNDTTWLTHSEGVPLCSNSHTTRSGDSTANGFDNLVTSALSSTALTAAVIQMRQYRGDRAERISIMPDEVLYPVDLYGRAHEIFESEGVPEDVINASNVHYKGFKSLVPNGWNYLTNTANWFLIDSSQRKNGFGPIWIDKVKNEFAFVEDIDTLMGKWRIYFYYGHGYLDWRWILGSDVT